jgi:hypothetical protein
MAPKILSRSALVALAVAAYEAEEGTGPFSPAAAVKAIAARKNTPSVATLRGIVDPVYFRKNGEAAPLVFARGKATPAAIRNAVRKRRDARGTLSRWDSLAASLSVALDGARVSEAAVKRYYEEAGGDLDLSYSGRGTRVGATGTRESETVEIDATL